MKNLDIENLERKNKGKIPDGFFEDMQEFVIAKSINKKENPGFTIKWIGNIAAAIVLLMGLVFLLPKNEDPKVPVFSENKILSSSTQEANITTAQTKQEEILPNEQINKKSLAENYNSKEKEIIVKEKSKIVREKETDNMDQVLSVLSEKELSEMANRNQPDIYLDLYY